VFLARFTAAVRAFVPLLAGMLSMSSRHFYLAAAILEIGSST
jgi:membrane protein DedA with SNARE-associated domain